MQLDDLKTLTGLKLKDLAMKLDEELPGDAYKPVPGGADLTDIDPSYMKQVLNTVFGLCGIGWGYRYDPDDLKVEAGIKPTSKGDKPAMYATLTQLTFWYVLVDDAGNESRIEVPASGGSDNSNAAYALKGAITSALSAAASLIGFQESVYLGHRSHHTVKGSKKAPAYARPTTASSNGNGNGKTTTVPPAIQTCPVHKVPMRQYPRQDHKGTYFAHQIDGKWCYGKTPAANAKPTVPATEEHA